MLLLLLAFCGAPFVINQRRAAELKTQGAHFVAELEAKPAVAPKPPEHFTYKPYDDGGYTLYFPEPAFFLPTDFFYVWNRADKHWTLLEYGELPQD